MESLIDIYNLYKTFEYKENIFIVQTFLFMLSYLFYLGIVAILVKRLNLPSKHERKLIRILTVPSVIIALSLKFYFIDKKIEENKMFNEQQLIKINENLTNEQKLLLNNEVYLYLIEKKRTPKEDIVLLPKEVLLERTDKIYFSAEEVNEFFKYKRRDFLSHDEQQIKNEVETLRKELKLNK